MRERKQNRLNGFDYSRDALYFVTICTQNRICHFGKIEKGEMYLNRYGEIAQTQWHWLTEQYPYVVSHAFVVMPNHIHAVIEIDSDRVIVVTSRDLSLQLQFQRPIVKKIKSLSEIMGAFKTTTSKIIHQNDNQRFIWQRSFHDHIIRDGQSCNRIINYILTNPERWTEDSLFL